MQNLLNGMTVVHTSYQSLPSHLVCLLLVTHALSPLCLSVQRGESALQIAVRKGHLDLVKVLVQVYRDLHMDNEVDQYYMDLADDHHHEHLVEYLSSEFPTLKRKVTHRLQYSTNTYAPPVLVFGHIICCLSHNLSGCCRTYILCLCRHIHTVMCSSPCM